MAITLQSNFNKLKDEFKKETGLDWNTNLDTYISYVNMRVNDYSFQVNMQILSTLKIYDSDMQSLKENVYKIKEAIEKK